MNCENASVYHLTQTKKKIAMYETYKSPLIAAALIIASILVYILFAMPDRRSTKAGDASMICQKASIRPNCSWIIARQNKKRDSIKYTRKKMKENSSP